MRCRVQLQVAEIVPVLICRHPTILPDVFLEGLLADLREHRMGKMAVREGIELTRVSHRCLLSSVCRTTMVSGVQCGTKPSSMRFLRLGTGLCLFLRRAV